VPTLLELGYLLPLGIYYSLWGPERNPKDVVNIIYEAYKKATRGNQGADPQMAGGQDHKIMVVGGEELKRMYQEQWVVVEKIVKESGDRLR